MLLSFMQDETLDARPAAVTYVRINQNFIMIREENG